MATLAQQSPFCHKFFQSRKGMKVADMFFTNIRQSVVRSAIHVMYGKSVKVSVSDTKRVTSFLNLLGVKFKVSSTVDVDDASLDNTSFPANIEVQAQVQAAEDKTKEIDNTKNEPIFNHPGEKVDSKSVNSIEPMPTTSQTKRKLDWDNWTNTTTDSERFQNIRQTVVKDSHGRKMYKCNICSVSSLDFSAAEKHYRSQHRNLEKELNLLKRVQTQRIVLNGKFQELSTRGKNILLMENESKEILETFQNFESELSILPADLPSHMETKKRELLKKLKGDVILLNTFIDNLDTE